MLIVGFGLLTRVVRDAIAMVRRGVQRVELERSGARVDDVVACSRGDEHRESRTDGGRDAVESRFARALFDAEELVERVDFLADLA